MTQSSLLKALAAELRQFAAERDWEKFHSPKNLAMALTVEAAELQELFQWMSTDESSELTAQQIENVEEEIADVLIYLVRLADQLNIDLLKAAEKKIEVNEKKYPANIVRGRANKYTEY